MQPIELAVASPRSAARQTVRGARARQDWPELLSQATRIQRETPNEPDGYVLAAIALRRLQRRPTLVLACRCLAALSSPSTTAGAAIGQRFAQVDPADHAGRIGGFACFHPRSGRASRLARRSPVIRPIALLRGGLESVGEEALTTLYLNCEREYMLADRRLLIEDAAISEMHRALRQRSAAPWVCIRNAAAGETPVTVTDGGDGLLVATMPAHGLRLPRSRGRFVDLGATRRLLRFACWLRRPWASGIPGPSAA